MKKNLILKTLFLLFLFTSSLYADQDKGFFTRFSVGLNVAFDSDFEGASESSFVIGSSDYDAGFLGSLAVGYKLNKNIAFEIEYASRTNSISGVFADGGMVLDSGDTSVDSFLLNLLVSFDNSFVFDPYIGIGVGFGAGIDYEVEVDGFGGFRQEDDNPFAFQFIAGANYDVSDSVALFTELRIFSLSSPNVINEVGTFNINYDTIGLTAGLTYSF